MYDVKHVVLVILCAIGTVQPLCAAEPARFAVQLLGVRIGQLEMSGGAGGGAYAARARFRTTGAAGLLARVRFDLAADGATGGAVADGGLVPAHYSEDMHTGRRRSASRLEAARGLLAPVGNRGTAAAPAPPPGALDPMTALFAALRDQPEAALCRLDAPVFDGERHTRIRLTGRAVTADGIACSGTFSRVSGYSAGELAERRHFPLSVTYRRQGRLWRAMAAEVRTLHGKVRLVRVD